MELHEIKKNDFMNTLWIGGMCSASYLGVYIVRNLLSVVSPQIIENSQASSESIGYISSAFFVTYAVGQLFHGVVGDRIKAKYMVSVGLTASAVCNWLLPYVIERETIGIWLYGVLGFFLAMIYAPMVKTISENTSQLYAEKCNLALSFAALLGAPVAGLIAAVISWKTAFMTVSVLVMLLGFANYVVFSVLERKRVIEYRRNISKTNGAARGITCLLKRKIVLFTVISALTGIVRTAVVFWLPRYLSEYLSVSSKNAALIFSGITMGISLSTFVAIMIYNKLHRNMEATILLSFAISTVSFGMLVVIRQPVVNVALIALAVMASNCASSIVWTVYCPSLYNTGLVSTATGYLDFVSYMAAAVSNAVFANAVNEIGWEKVIMVWTCIMALGIVAMVADWVHSKKKIR